MPAPVESAAENTFVDQVLGSRSGADAHPEIDLPERGDVEVGDGEDLLLLVMGRGEGAEATVVGVVFEPATHSRTDDRSGIGEPHHETLIHVTLLVAVKQGGARAVGGELNFGLGLGGDQHDIIDDAAGASARRVRASGK